MNLPRMMVRRCRGALFRKKIADSSGMELTGGKLLMRTLILRRLLLREVLTEDEQHVGVLIPPSCGGVITNAAVTLAGRVAVNLNYTVTSDVMNACIERASIRHVLTSRQVMKKLDLKIDAPLVYLEDFRKKLRTSDKLVGAACAFGLPAALTERILGLTARRDDDPLTVIFTSGSTGIPKGVVLSYGNVGTNVDAIDKVIHLRRGDVFLGILPFFHSFGYMVVLWGALALDVGCAYHFTPLDAKEIGSLVQRHQVNIILSTPTFLRSYLRRCSAEEFRTLEIAVAGAEKLPSSLCDAFEEKFGVRPVEGYGCTELSPLVSVNIPPTRSPGDRLDLKEGTVGRPIPDVQAKVVDPDTFEPLPQGESGMLLIHGPNVMQGYLGEPEKTAEVLRDGWYVTGDIARIDEDGFIQITGRLSRFSKIGGEMVPHVRIEESLLRIVGGDEDEVLLVVTAVPDARKGERLIVVHRPLPKTPDELREGLVQEGLPNLWIPSADSFIEVEDIPLLGTGKLDLRGVAELAKQRTVKA